MEPGKKLVEIKHRHTGRVLYSAEVDEGTEHPLREVVVQAVREGAYLGAANLGGANLGGAYLVDAYLVEANLGGAYLGGAYLGGAYLGGAYLGDANLVDAYLVGANLDGAYLVGANLDGAYLDGAYLDGARGLPPGFVVEPDTIEKQRERAAKFRERFPDVPVVPDLDRRIAEIVDGGKGLLDMSHWHGEEGVCGTTHCRAGWAVHLAGEPGYELEDRHGSAGAGARIYLASVGYVPSFYASTEDALEDVRARAAQQVEAAS